MSSDRASALESRVWRVALRGLVDYSVIRQVRAMLRGARSQSDVVRRAVERVLRVPYKLDPPGTDDILPVADVLANTPCDCEDRAAAVVCIALIGGVDAAPRWVRVSAAREDHMSSIAWVSGRWIWCDATPPGRVGGDPQQGW